MQTDYLIHLMIFVPEEQHDEMEQFGLHLKCERSIRSKDVIPRKMRGKNQYSALLESISFEEAQTLD